MSSNQPGTPRRDQRSWRRYLRLSGLVAAVEAAFVLLYAVAILGVAPNSEGATEGNPFVEALIFVIFAILIGFIAKSLLAERLAGRPAFILTQVFVLIVAWTVFVGDGFWLKAIGTGLAVFGAAGLFLVIASIVKQPIPEG